MSLGRPGPFVSASLTFFLIIGYLSVAQFTKLPSWKLDVSSGFGILEFVSLSLIAIALVRLASRERRSRRLQPTVDRGKGGRNQ